MCRYCFPRSREELPGPGALISRYLGTTRCISFTMLVAMPTNSSSPAVEHPSSPATMGTIIELPGLVEAPSLLRYSGGVPCQREDPALWFSSVVAELNLAKAYCRGCRNRQSCLAGALEREEPAGVWGGEIFERGQIIEFKRPRGRPRKTPPVGGRK
jgi:WhiB family transcriptional regulator, redox-sensing transcriptional regulator